MNISSGKDGDLSCEKKIISEEDFNEIKMAHRIDDKIRGIHKRRAMFKERNQASLRLKNLKQYYDRKKRDM